MQTESERTASRTVANWLAAHEKTNAWLVDQTKSDKGTIGTFLAGETWPRRGTLARIEKALGWSVGTITDIAEGRADPPDLPTVSRTRDDDSTLLFRKPAGLPDAEWERIKASSMEYIEWQISQADRER